ncbi:hypothetical protein GCM10009556_004580 [Acrocarpospora pleiomorpha]
MLNLDDVVQACDGSLEFSDPLLQALAVVSHSGSPQASVISINGHPASTSATVLLMSASDAGS